MLLPGTKALGDPCGNAMFFTDTLYRDTAGGKDMVNSANDEQRNDEQHGGFSNATMNGTMGAPPARCATARRWAA